MVDITLNGSVTLDESLEYQNSGTASGSEDNNDNDVLLTTLQSDASAFYTRLFDTLGLSTSFASFNGVARSAANFIAISNADSVTDIGFVNGSGQSYAVYDPLSSDWTNGTDSELTTLDGSRIFLFVDNADSGLGNKAVFGVEEDSGDIVFALYLQPNGDLDQAELWMVQFEPIHHPNPNLDDEAVDLDDVIGVAVSSSTDFKFDTLPSGQNLFGMVQQGTSGVVVIGAHPVINASTGVFTNASNTINTSQGGGPTTIGVNNQMFDPNEGAYFTFVKNPNMTVNGLDQNEVDDADNIRFSERLEGTGGYIKISQTQGNVAPSLTLTLFNGDNATGKAFVNGLVPTNSGTMLTLDYLLVSVSGAPDAIITQASDGKSVSITNLVAGARIEWHGAPLHDQVLVTANGGKFDIGGVGIDEPNVLSIDIGSHVLFEDDAPSALLELDGTPELRVDETAGADSGETAPAGMLGRAFKAGTDVFNKLKDSVGNDIPGALGEYSLLIDEDTLTGVTDSASGLAVRFHRVDDDTITGRVETAPGTYADVFQIDIDKVDGDVSFALMRAVMHGNADDPDESDTPVVFGGLGTGKVTARLTVVDEDQDSRHSDVDLTGLFKIEDDGPAVTLSRKSSAEIRVDESFDANGSPETEPGTSLGRMTVAADDLFSSGVGYGSDGAGASGLAWSLSLSAPGADSGLDDTATGASVLLYKDGNDIVGKAGASGPEVLRISINATTGAVTLDQSRAVIHGDTGDPDEAGAPRTINGDTVFVSLSATDKDGDHDSKSVSIGEILMFEDDGPAIGPISDGQVDFAVNSSVTHSLLGAIGNDPRANPYTIIDYDASLSFNDVVLHGLINGDKTEVRYWADTGDNGTYGDAGDAEYYRLKLDQTANGGAGAYTFSVIAAPQLPRPFPFDDLPSGQNLFGVVGDVDEALVVIARNPNPNSSGMLTNSSNSINTSKGGGSVTIGVNNQMFDPGEGAFFTFVNDPNPAYLSGVPGGLDQNEADNQANIQFGSRSEHDGAYLKISQKQGNQSGTMWIRLIDGDNTLPTDTQASFVSSLGAGTKVAITEIIVRHANGTSTTVNPLTQEGDYYVISGLTSGDKVEWHAAGKFDQVEVQCRQGKWDIGEFGTLEPPPVPDQELCFTVQAIDGDGDTASDEFCIQIDGTGIYDGASQPLVTTSAMSVGFLSDEFVKTHESLMGIDFMI